MGASLDSVKSGTETEEMSADTDLRERLLQVALELIAEGGLAALSIRAVARRASVSHQAPYHYFADREQLLAALSEQGFRRLIADFERVSSHDDDDPLRRLERLGAAYLRFALRHPGQYALMFRRDVVDHHRHPALAEAGGCAFQTLVDAVTAIHAAGRLRGGAPDQLSVVIWSTVHGAASLWRDGALQTKAEELDEEGLIALVTSRLSAMIEKGNP